MITRISLSNEELAALNLPLAGDGGFQRLLNSMRLRAGNSGHLALTDTEVGRIARYAYRYRNGGWQARLEAIFGRHVLSRA